MKPSPVFLLHHGAAPAPEGEPDLTAELEGVVSRLWRIDDPDAIAAGFAGVEEPLLIADGHHRYETALRYHEEQGTEETGHVLAVLVGKDDAGSTIFPTHRVVRRPRPRARRRAPADAARRPRRSGCRARARSRATGPAFVLLRPDGAVARRGAARPTCSTPRSSTSSARGGRLHARARTRPSGP